MSLNPITGDKLDWLCKTPRLISSGTGEIPIFMASLICMSAADFYGVLLFDWQNESDRKFLMDEFLNDNELPLIRLKDFVSLSCVGISCCQHI